MKIYELCTRCGVTKKAVAYAVEQGLLAPSTQENGYRDFTEADADRMSRIATLRMLGLSTAEIRRALNGEWTAVVRQHAVETAAMAQRHSILTSLAAAQDWPAAREAAARHARSQPVTERLKCAFPGPLGRFFAAHFAPYLMAPIVTEEQQSAFEEAVAWLDSASFDVPEDLAEHAADLALQLDDSAAQAFDARMNEALQDQQAYIDAHREEIEQWQRIKASPEYQQSPGGRLERWLREYMAQSGYNDVFIPAMRRLSPLYDAYQRRLQAANEAFQRALDKKTEEAP